MEMLRRVRLKPRGLAQGTFSGPHKSHYRGTAVEFADYRNYVDGDDVRLVDWKVYARTDKHYVRLYEAERNLLAYLVVDTSESMDYQGVVQVTERKLDYACRLAAAIGYLVVSAGDEVGLSLADTRVHEHLVPRASWPHLAAMVETLGGARAKGRTDLGSCLMEVYRRVVRRGVLVILSDFLDPSPDLWKSIDLFRRSKFDVMLFHVMHPEEIDLPDVPMARFHETEGRGGFFNAEPEIVRELYCKKFASFLMEVEAGSKTRGCDWYAARTDVDPYLFLKQCFLARDYQR
jgi:uncharacterized protein (DUF58 family)